MADEAVKKGNTFKDIAGQSGIVEHLQNAIKLNKSSHAYIFSGEAGMGKKMIARVFAMTLQCEEGGTEPCMQCKSCKQSLSMNQPDIKWVRHEKPSSISVEEIREQINSDIQIKPYSSPRKIYIVDEAEKMTQAAQNALLKTIEEPPAYGVIILLTTNTSMLLPTIQSRCVELAMKAVPKDDIKRHLIYEEKIPEAQAEMAAVFAGGNLGKAIKLATSDDFINLKEDVLSVIKNIENMTVAEVGDYIKKTEGYKLEIDDYLDLMRVWYRDVLMYKVSKNVAEIIFKDEYKEISHQASKLSYNGLEIILEAIDKVKIRLKSNVNYELTIELLYLTIREQMA